MRQKQDFVLDNCANRLTLSMTKKKSRKRIQMRHNIGNRQAGQHGFNSTSASEIIRKYSLSFECSTQTSLSLSLRVNCEKHLCLLCCVWQTGQWDSSHPAAGSSEAFHGHRTGSH